VELAPAVPSQPGRLTVAAIGHLFAISRVAQMLDEISIEMNPEDGRIVVWGIGEGAIKAFTDLGVENLAEIVRIYKAQRPDVSPR
jgi:hypothetical protein